MSRRDLPWIAAGITAALLVALKLGGDSVVSGLRYDRAALADGEWWRWLTASLVHAGWSHVAVNLAALALAGLTVGEALAASRWAVSFVVSALAVTLGLWLWSPEVHWYLGASGALHGLFVAGATTPDMRREPAGMVILALVTAKLAWEQLAGPLPGSRAAAGVAVIVDAHLYGAIGGLAFTAVAAVSAPLLRSLIAKRKTHG
jgi:rhomboid family GlyGly-CTERM serine protease